MDLPTGADRICDVSGTGEFPSCGDLPSGFAAVSFVRLERGRGNRTVAAYNDFGGAGASLFQFADVTADKDFGTAGRADIKVPDATEPIIQGLAVAEVAAQSEIYALGDAKFGSSRRMFVTKFDEAGKPVTSFGSNGFASVDFVGLDKEVGVQLWPEGDNLYVLFLSADPGESAALKGKLHVARLWR
jgi:hypothetical protein